MTYFSPQHITLYTFCFSPTKQREVEQIISLTSNPCTALEHASLHTQLCRQELPLGQVFLTDLLEQLSCQHWYRRTLLCCLPHSRGWQLPQGTAVPGDFLAGCGACKSEGRWRSSSSSALWSLSQQVVSPPCPHRSPTPARAYSIHSVSFEDRPEVPWIYLFLLLPHSVTFADHKPVGTAAAVIQRHPESKAKGCCPCKASKRYRCLSPLLPRIQNVQSSQQPLCSPNRAATVPDILPRLFFAPAVPGRRCHLIVSLFLWCFGRKTEGFFFFF